MEEIDRPGPLLAVSSIIISMSIVAVSSGLMFAWLPVRLASLDFAPWVAGSMIMAMTFGGIIGCLATGPVVSRCGHARAFSVMAGLEIIGFLVIGLFPEPAVWLAARILYGFAVTGLFIIAQSWLNDATENAWRGRVIAIFFTSYVMCIGFGSLILRFAPLEGATVPILCAVIVTLGIFPTAFTRLPAPGPPESIKVAFRAVWQISPVGLTGLFCVGGLTMLIQGFAPIYATSIGYSKEQVGLLLFLMQFGMLAIQMPLGMWSDRTDRRRILLLASALVCLLAVTTLSLSDPAFWLIVILFGIWAGATESIYSIASAHANDRADPQYYVSLSSTLLIAWSISGFIIPSIATALTPVFGPRFFMVLAAVLAGFYGLFVLMRLRLSDPVPEPETEPYVAIGAQLPYAPELAAGDVDPDIEQVVPEAERDP